MSIVAITGGSGFLGQKVVREFAKAGFHVNILSRTSHHNITHPNVTLFQVDYGDVSSLSRAFENVEIVIHLADNANRFTSSSDIDCLSTKVVSAMTIAGVRRMIFTSSIYARLNEEGYFSTYGAQKLASESVISNESLIDPIFLRLPPVYGSGGRGGFAFLTKMIAKKKPLPFGTAHVERDYISLVNVVDLIIFLSKLDERAWNKLAHLKFEPSDESPISLVVLSQKIGYILNVRPLLLPIPKFIILLVSKLLGKEKEVSSAYLPLSAKKQPSLTELCGWQPIEKIPESLVFLSKV